MPALAYVSIPHWAVRLEEQRQPQLAGRAVIIGESRSGAATVLAASEAALRLGLRVGMPVRQAQALCPQAQLLIWDPAYYEQGFAQLLEHALNYVPAVEPAGLGAFYADIRGLCTLYGHWEGLRQALLAPLPRRLRPAVGLGPNKFVAQVAALGSAAGVPSILTADDLPQALRAVSIAMLPISEALYARLTQLGLTTLGELAQLPARAVLTQLGTEGRFAWELAWGRDPRPFVPRTATVPWQASVALPDPSRERSHFFACLEELAQRLFAAPEHRGRSIRQLLILAELETRERWERTLTLQEPAFTATSLMSALRARLGQLLLPAALVQVSLTVTRPGPPAGRPLSLFAWQGERLSALRESVARLKSRFGQSPLYRIVEVEPWSRIPERRYMLISFEP